MLKKLFTDETGQGLIEYGLVVALIAVIAIIAVRLFGDRVSGMYANSNDQVS